MKREPIPCKECGSERTVIRRTHTYPNGARLLKMVCRDCNAPFKHLIGEVPVTTWQKHEFDDATFMRIIAGSESLTKLAKRLGCSYELLRQIRCGILHRHRMPDVQRTGPGAPPAVIPDGPSCWHCSEWRQTYCAMGFPDPTVEGPGFASECALYPEMCCQ